MPAGLLVLNDAISKLTCCLNLLCTSTIAFFSVSLNPFEAGVIAQDGRASIQRQSKLITKQNGCSKISQCLMGRGVVFYIMRGQRDIAEGRVVGWVFW